MVPLLGIIVLTFDQSLSPVIWNIIGQLPCQLKSVDDLLRSVFRWLVNLVSSEEAVAILGRTAFISGVICLQAIRDRINCYTLGNLI